MKDNVYITAMTFMSNLLGLYGAYYENNPALVDARLPSLIELRDGVTVDGCDRLCPARYTVLGASPSDAGCPTRRMEYYFWVTGAARVSDLPLLAEPFRRLVTNLTNNVVCSSLTMTCILGFDASMLS